MDSINYFLSNETLEILIYLFFQQNSLTIHKFNYTYKFNFNFTDDLNRYPEYKLNEIIKYSESEDQKSFTFVLTEKKLLENFLKDYLNLYKNDQLNIKGDNDYYPYATNLFHIREVLQFYYKKESSNSKLNLNSHDIREAVLPIASKKVRLSEFILDISFNFEKDKYIKINEYEILNKGLVPSIFTLKINITLNKLPDEIFKAMLFKFYCTQPLGEYNDTHLTSLTKTEKEHAPKILQAYADGAKSKVEIAEMVGLSATRVKDIEEAIRGAYNLETLEQVLIKASQENIIRVNSTF